MNKLLIALLSSYAIGGLLCVVIATAMFVTPNTTDLSKMLIGGFSALVGIAIGGFFTMFLFRNS